MLHSIEDLTNKVNVLKDKVTVLHNSQYRMTDEEIKHAIEDIQALARDIANDTQSASPGVISPYP